MTITDRIRAVLPPKHRELVKFLVVGGAAWLVDIGLFTLLSHSILDRKVLTAKTISVLVATVISYVLNREWSFSHRGGRETHHEALLFFIVNGVALGLNLIPLGISRYLLKFDLEHHSQLTVTVADFIAANILGTIVAMIFRLWAYRRFVFPDA